MKKIRMNKFISLFLSAIMILTIFPSYALAEASDAFEVTFFGWGNSVLKTQQVNAGENATPPESVPTPDGKQFTGWTGNYKNVNQNESVYAQFSDVYTVTFLGGADKTSVLKTEVVLSGGSATAPSDKGIPAGERFVGWDVAFNNVTKDLVVTAQYAPLRDYTVTFLGGADGKTVLGTENVKEFQSAKEPADKGIPDPDTQIFDGWDSEAYLSVTGDELNIVIHAVYAPIEGARIMSFGLLAPTTQQYTVTYTSGGATGTPPASQTVDTGTVLSVPTPTGLTPPNSDPVFYYWKDTATNETYKLGSAITVTKNTSLVAVWGKGWQLNLNVGSGGSAYLVTITAPVYPVITPNQLYPTYQDITIKAVPNIGWTLKGFFKNNGGAGEFTNYVYEGNGIYSLTISASSNTNMVYVKFEQPWFFDLHEVNYVRNYGFGGTGSAPNDSNDYAEHNMVTVLGQNTMNWPGHQFLGWSLTWWASSPDYSPGSTFDMPDHNVTLYGVWRDSTYTVTYDANNGSGSTTTDPNLANNSTYTVKNNSFTAPTGKHFTGWNTQANGSGTSYAAGATFTISGDKTLYAQWAYDTFTVSYNANTGTGSMGSDTNLQYNSTYTTKNNGFTAPSHKHFSGWNTQANGSGTAYAAGATFPVTSNVTLYAQWAYDTFTVSYNANGGTGSVSSDLNREYNSTYTTKSNGFTAPANKHFTGWNTQANGSGTGYAAGATFTITGNVTLYAQWAYDTFTVSYNANTGTGSMSSDLNQPYNSTYTTKSNGFTAPANKHFTGWNTQANGSGTGYAAGATFTITGNVTLYAQWAYDTFTVSYDANTGTGSMSSDLNQPYNSTYATKSNGFTAPANKHFTGWNTQANGSGTGYAAGATFTITGNVTLYAQWAYDTFTVSYDANTGTGSMSSDLNQPYNSTYATKSNGFTAPANKHFTGWNTQANGSGTGYAAGAIFTITGNVTLYAQWTFDDQYDVLYDANGGSATVPTDGASYFADDTVTALFSPAPTRSGFNFLGWATTSDATTATYTEGGTESFTMGASDVTLYAVWDPIEYAVSYNANGGIGPVPTDSTIYYMHDTATVLFTPAPTRSGYNFLGWATTSDATTATYTEGGTESFTMGVNDVTLYAVWEAIDYSVTYDANGGIGPVPTDSALYHIEDTVTVLFTPAPTRLGFNFVGWSTNIEAATPMYATSGTTTFEMGASDVTLYAVWDPIEYAVSYDANGGIGPVPTDSTIYYMDDTATVLFAPAPTRNGYTFKGWATASDATTPTYTTGGTTTFVMGTTDVTLYAVWELIEYKITYVMGGGTNVLTNPTTYTVESPLITLEAPARAGYNFLAWTPGNTIPAGSTGDKTVTATWSAPIIYPITYVMNGGVNAAANPATYTIESPAIALAAPVQAGYVFLGWTPVGGIPVGSIGPRVFTANWSAPIIYNITYVMNGGTNAPGNPATYTVESPLITLDDPTRTGYDFLGWTQTDNIPAGSVGDVTFTATWSQPHVHTVTYYVNGGTATGLDGAEPYIVYSNVAYGTVVPVPVNPDQAEFTFDGWTTAIPVNMPDEDVVIYGSMTRLPVLQEIITNERTPLAGPTWALMNLILAIVTALATASIFTLLKKNREVEPTKRRKVFRWSTLIPAAGAIVAFLLTENMSNSMVLTDRWTLLMLGIAAVQILVVVLGFQKNKQNA